MYNLYDEETQHMMQNHNGVVQLLDVKSNYNP